VSQWVPHFDFCPPAHDFVFYCRFVTRSFSFATRFAVDWSFHRRFTVAARVFVLTPRAQARPTSLFLASYFSFVDPCCPLRARQVALGPAPRSKRLRFHRFSLPASLCAAGSWFTFLRVKLQIFVCPVPAHRLLVPSAVFHSAISARVTASVAPAILSLDGIWCMSPARPVFGCVVR
jgi:hypothetical protein